MSVALRLAAALSAFVIGAVSPAITLSPASEPRLDLSDRPHCQLDEVGVRPGPFVEPAASQEPRSIAVVHLHGRPCRLTGYPSLRFVDRRGDIVAFKIRRGHDVMIAPTLPQPVVVRPDDPAAFVFNKMRCGADVVARARTVQIRLPGQHAWRDVRVVSGYAFCSPQQQQSVVHVSPIGRSVRAVLR